MSSDANAGSQWQRVAAELRACREAQQRAWGDIDNTTLGRYLADEVSREEREHIESALAELPELRKLTDLVRDVLGEGEPAAAPMSVPYGPAVVPYSPRPAAAPGPLARPATPAMRPGQPWKPRTPAARYRQRAGLATAAAVLLALGVALPRFHTAAPPESSLAMAQPAAMHANVGAFLALHEGAAAARDAEMDPARQPDLLLARIDASVQALEADGKAHEAKALARQYASNLRRKALYFQQKGDLARAEPVLSRARSFCARTLGPQAPETVRNRNTLAEVYETALNATPPAMDSSPRRHAPPLRSASSYGPSAPQSADERPPVPGPSPRMQQAYFANHPASLAMAQQPASALRDRLTNQRQEELRTAVVPVLAQALHETADAGERQRLAWALGQLGPAAREAVPVLVGCYRKAADPAEQSAVLLALGRIGPAARQAVPVLLDALHSESAPVRASAAQALLQLGPAARSGCRQLGTKGTNDALVHEVVRRLNGPEGRIGIDDECECFSLRTLQQMQHEIDRLAKAYRVEVLVETTPHASEALPRVSKAHSGERGPYSVHVRICKDASDVQLVLSEGLRRQGLTEARVREVMLPSLKSKDYDGSLRAGVQFLAHFERETARGRR